jgi:hypothetical protein
MKGEISNPPSKHKDLLEAMEGHPLQIWSPCSSGGVPFLPISGYWFSRKAGCRVRVLDHNVNRRMELSGQHHRVRYLESRGITGVSDRNGFLPPLNIVVYTRGIGCQEEIGDIVRQYRNWMAQTKRGDHFRLKSCTGRVKRQLSIRSRRAAA